MKSLNCGSGEGGGENQLERPWEKLRRITKSEGERKRRKSVWTGHVLGRKCLLNHVIEAKMKGAGR